MKSPRDFQTWAYRVSHGELLIRSPKTSSETKNIDLIFVGVEYMSLPRFFSGIEVVEPSDEERRQVTRTLGERQPGQVYVLLSEGRRHLICAGFFKVMETDLDLFETPFVGLKISYNSDVIDKKKN